MHRTHADGNVTESTYYRFIDRDLVAIPVVPGTVDIAEWNNAVQEEICNVITGVGNTLNGGGANGSPVADRAQGWTQLYTAIFDSGHLTDAGVDGLTFAKLSGTIDLDDGSTFWYQDRAQCLYRNDVSSFLVRIKNLGIETVANSVQADYNGKGVRYHNGPGNLTDFKNARLRKSAYHVSDAAISWTDANSVGIWTTTYDFQFPDLLYGEVTPDRIKSIKFLRAVSATDSIVYSPASVVIATGSPPDHLYAGQTVIANGNSTSDPGTEFVIVVEYDALYLTIP